MPWPVLSHLKAHCETLEKNELALLTADVEESEDLIPDLLQLLQGQLRLLTVPASIDRCHEWR